MCWVYISQNDGHIGILAASRCESLNLSESNQSSVEQQRLCTFIHCTQCTVVPHTAIFPGCLKYCTIRVILKVPVWGPGRFLYTGSHILLPAPKWRDICTTVKVLAAGLLKFANVNLHAIGVYGEVKRKYVR